jgi:NADH:ubiquinone oxidoreductase subunit 3 (subunit A)
MATAMLNNFDCGEQPSLEKMGNFNLNFFFILMLFRVIILGLADYV